MFCTEKGRIGGKKTKDRWCNLRVVENFGGKKEEQACAP